MKLKINWIIYFLIGAISIYLLSCKKVDYLWKTTYVYSNNSDYTIHFKVYNESRNLIREFSIPMTDSTTFVFYSDGSPAPPFFFAEDVVEVGDSISVTFNSLKYLTYVRGISSIQNIFDYRNYSEKKLGKKEVRYTLRFTNEHFNNAIPIN